MDIIKTFDPKKLKDNFFMYIIGMRRSGKTTLIKDLLYNSKIKFDEVYLISETADLSGDYDDYIKYNHIFNLEKADEVLKAVENQQRTTNKQFRKKILFILDDVITDDHKGTWNILAFMGRHLNASVILLSQSMKSISTVTRKNADYALMSTSRNYDDIEAFVKQYLTGSYGEGQTASDGLKNSMSIYNDITKEPFNFIFIDNSAQTRNINEFVYKYKGNNINKKFNIYTPHKQKIQNAEKDSKLYKDIKNKIIYSNNIKKDGIRNKRKQSITANEPDNRRPPRDLILQTNILFSRKKRGYDIN
jgi:AAA+ ATPase superfamily predicted ATPase